MKSLTLPKLFCLFMLITEMGFSASSVKSDVIESSKREKIGKQVLIPKAHFKGNRFATSVFKSVLQGTPQPYPISAVPQAETNTTVPLSMNRSGGSKSGAIKLTSDGLEVEKSGDYWVEFSAIIIENFGSTRTFTVYVKKSEDFSLNDPLNVRGSVFISATNSGTVRGAGLLKNLKKGTRLSLIIQGSDNEGPVFIRYWNISIMKLGSRKHEDRT